jgi:uncharacterized protein (DUF779 family)
VSVVDERPRESISAPDGVDQDLVFDILKNRRRRQVLRYLLAIDGSASIGDLAEQLAAWENDVSKGDITYKQRKRVYISLHQTHLPKLHDASVVDYDERSGMVSLTDGIEAYRVHLDLDPTAVNEDAADESVSSFRPPGLFAGLGMVGLFSVLVTAFGLDRIGITPTELVFAIVATVVVAAAAWVSDSA